MRLHCDSLLAFCHFLGGRVASQLQQCYLDFHAAVKLDVLIF